MNKLFGIKYMQEGQYYISLVLPMKYIIDNSCVLVYGEDEEYGYQRAPRKAHYVKIAKQLLKDQKRSVSPNSIILGINQEDLIKKMHITNQQEFGGQCLLELELGNDSDLKFRIIDGQHRVKGFEEAIEKCEGDDLKKGQLENFCVNVIIMLLDKQHRLPEVYAFSDINSKAKPLKMDLTILAEYQYLLKEQPKEINSENFLATRVIMLLNKGEKCKYWTNGIIIDVNASSRAGCIGFKSFLESISLICKRKLAEFGEENLPENFKEKCKVLYDFADEIYCQLSECWNLVFEKWPITKEQWFVEGGDNVLTYYNKDYYLQRTMGAFAINKLIAESIRDHGSIDQFKEIIELCDLTTEDWRIDGQFAGISSLSGANKIKDTVMSGYNAKYN
jgi:DGQHR domain-containing protein